MYHLNYLKRQLKQDYSEENNLLPNSQFGFSKGLGTKNALANLIVMK
jgi:hypothetical protein